MAPPFVMSDFDSIFKAVAKKVEKDPHASMYASGDPRLKSTIPYAVPTGLPELDLQIGRPGWPAGRVIEVFGFEHSGKSTLAMHAAASVQRIGGACMWIDLESTWDELRAQQIGINTDPSVLSIMDAGSLEGGLRSVFHTVKTAKESGLDKPMLIVVDSITAKANELMYEKEIGEEERVGQDARAIRGGMRRLIDGVAESKIIVMIVNQSIAKIASFGKQSQSSGGHSIKFVSTARVEMAHMGWVKEGEKRVGQKVKINIEKLKGSRLEQPEVKAVLRGDCGFDTNSSLLDAMVTVGMVKRTNRTNYYFEPLDENFLRGKWDEVVLRGGGTEAMYQLFRDVCIEKELMDNWGGFKA